MARSNVPFQPSPPLQPPCRHPSSWRIRNLYRNQGVCKKLFRQTNDQDEFMSQHLLFMRSQIYISISSSPRGSIHLSLPSRSIQRSKFLSVSRLAPCSISDHRLRSSTPRFEPSCSSSSSLSLRSEMGCVWM